MSDDLVRGFWGGVEKVFEYIPPWLVLLWLVVAGLALVASAT